MVTRQQSIDLRQHINKTSAWWEEKKKELGLALFKKASAQVPAYRHFLSNNGVDPSKINEFEDLQVVPPTTKNNYLRQYPMEELCWDGRLDQNLMISSSSGSTGSPYYFPRNQALEWKNSFVLESFFQQSQCKGPTLAINCFGMGVWIGGMIIYSALQALQQRSRLPISIIAPGVNKVEIINILLKLAPKFKEIVIFGYPPFVKDAVDSAVAAGVDFSAFDIKLMLASEVITERYRDHICRQLHMKNPYRDMQNIYGAADIGIIGVENAAGILIKRLPNSREKVFSDILPTTKTSTVAQYDPHIVNLDCQDQNLLVFGDSVIPLVKYSLGDKGGLFSFDHVEEMLRDSNLDLKGALRDHGITTINTLPFVYVYERIDFSLKFFGVIIYPDHIKPAIQDTQFSGFVTGRFCIEVLEDAGLDQYLQVNVELNSFSEPSAQLVEKLTREIKKSLLKNSTEYANNVSFLGDKVNPVVRLWQYGHEKYFNIGIKQKWVKKAATAS